MSVEEEIKTALTLIQLSRRSNAPFDCSESASEAAALTGMRRAGAAWCQYASAVIVNVEVKEEG